MAYVPVLAEYPYLLLCGNTQAGLILNLAVLGKHFETATF